MNIKPENQTSSSGSLLDIKWEPIFDAIGNPAIILDREHRVIAANSASSRLTGMTRDEIIGRRCFEVFHRNDSGGPAAGCPMERALQSNVMETAVMELEILGGMFLVSCTPVPDADGKLDKIIHIATDITSHKEIQQKLVAESDFNRSIIDNAPEGLSVCHGIAEFPFVRFTVWNERMTTITGYDMEEINSKGCYQTLFPDQEKQRMIAERMQRVRKGDNIEGDEWSIINKKGEERVVSIWTSLLGTDDGTGNVLAFFIDVSEHKKAMQEQRNFADSLVRNSTVAMFVLDNKHKVQVWNKACENLTGYGRADMVGTDGHWKAFYEERRQTLADVVLDGDFDRLPRNYTHVTRSEHSRNGYRAEGWFAQVNGKDRYFVIEAAPIFDRQGKMTHVLETISDLTGSKSLEEQLLQAQKMESIGHLSGGIAHEFNNILAVILGYGQVLAKGFEPDSTSMQDMEQILAAAERAAALTKGLLAFSRKQHISPKNLDVSALVHSTLKSFSRIMGDDIVIKEFLDSPLVVYADHAQLTQVLMNLMSNARDAMPNGGELVIRATEALLLEPYATVPCTIPAGKYAKIAVSDNGRGMDVQILQKIFEPFFTTKDVGKGTGLGLSVVYGIVSQHKGYLSVSSTPGFGTTFNLYIPLVEQLAAGHSVLKPPAGLPGGNETILLADDDPTLALLFCNILSEIGYHVITATDGVDALSKFAASQDDIRLLVLDVQMPRKSGLKVYEEIKAIKPECRVLFISGYNEEQFHGKMALEDGTELLVKPFSPIELAERVRKILDLAIQKNSGQS